MRSTLQRNFKSIQAAKKDKDPIAATIQDSPRVANSESTTVSDYFTTVLVDIKFLYSYDQKKFDKNLQETVKNKSRPWYGRSHKIKRSALWTLLATTAWLPIGSCEATDNNQYGSTNFETFLKMFFWGTGITLSLLNILVHPIWHQIGSRFSRMHDYNLLVRNADDEEQQDAENLVEVTINQ